jgi:hypothetical protein
MGHKSATTKLSERTLDLYNTPDWATRELLKRVAGIDGHIFECCVGDGRMAKVLGEHLQIRTALDAGRSARRVGQVNRTLTTNDINRKHKATLHRDATDPKAWAKHFPGCDWIITNPPFNVCPKIIPLAYEHARTGIAFLLRLSYLEPCGNRYKFLVEHPPNVMLVTPRISFKTVVSVNPKTGKRTISRTDNMTTAWFVWYKQRVKTQRLEIIPPLDLD